MSCKKCKKCRCRKDKAVIVKEYGRRPVILPAYKADAIRRYAAKDVFAVSGD